MYKVIVTGPESSGKTTLCNEISNYLKIPFAKEYSREYLTELSREYIQKDLTIIAKGQLKYEENSHLLDTDLITIKIWSLYKYGNCDDWILNKIEAQKKEERFYLLCTPDIIWERDPLRENPTNRMTLFRLYKKELEDLEHEYHILEKDNRSMDAVLKILHKNYIF